MLRRLRYLLDGHAKEVVKILSVEDDPDQPFFRAFRIGWRQVRTVTDPGTSSRLCRNFSRSGPS